MSKVKVRWKVMVSAPYMQLVIDNFRPFFEENDMELLIPPVKERLEEKELIELIGDVDGVICGDDKFTKKVFEKAKKLKVISKWGTGIDSIDQEEAQKNNVAVYNTPNAFTYPVADSVFGYILSFARKIPWATRDIQNGIWGKRPCVALRECVLGVIGMGNIGKEVIRRALVFGMKTIGNDIVDIDPEFLRKNKTVMANKNELLKRADFISLNCDLNKTSYHLIGEKEFSLMKPTAYIINTSRGAIIDEKALINALKGKKIAGAGLDVFECEPLPQDSLLKKMDNCLLAPHNANSSPQAWNHAHQNTIKNLLEELKKRG